MPPERRTPQQVQRITDILGHRWAKKKRKKRRKRRTPRTSSRSLRGRARRRFWQWHARNAGFPGDVPLRAMLPSVVVRPEMLGIMAGMDQKDNGALIVDSGSGMCKARFAGYDAPCVVFPSGVAKPKMLRILAGMDQFTVQTAETVVVPQLQSIQVVDIPFVPSSFSSDSGYSSCDAETGTHSAFVHPPVQLLDKVLDVPVVVLRQVPGLMVQKTVVRPQLQYIYGRRHSLSFSRGSSPWSRLFGRPQRFLRCRSFSGGQCPCCAGRACHTCCCQRQVRKAQTLQKTFEVPQLQFIKFVDNSLLWCRS